MINYSKIGKIGVKIRWSKISKKKRSEYARKIALIRWGKKYPQNL